MLKIDLITVNKFTQTIENHLKVESDEPVTVSFENTADGNSVTIITEKESMVDEFDLEQYMDELGLEPIDEDDVSIDIADTENLGESMVDEFDSESYTDEFDLEPIDEDDVFTDIADTENLGQLLLDCAEPNVEFDDYLHKKASKEKDGE